MKSQHLVMGKVTKTLGPLTGKAILFNIFKHSGEYPITYYNAYLASHVIRSSDNLNNMTVVVCEDMDVEGEALHHTLF